MQGCWVYQSVEFLLTWLQRLNMTTGRESTHPFVRQDASFVFTIPAILSLSGEPVPSSFSLLPAGGDDRSGVNWSPNPRVRRPENPTQLLM